MIIVSQASLYEHVFHPVGIFDTKVEAVTELRRRGAKWNSFNDCFMKERVYFRFDKVSYKSLDI